MRSETAGVGVSGEEAALAEGNHSRAVGAEEPAGEINRIIPKSQTVLIKKMFSAQ